MNEEHNLSHLIRMFDDNHELKEVILLGKEGGVRRIILSDEENEE